MNCFESPIGPLMKLSSLSLNLILKSMHEGLLLFDQAGVLLDVNEAAQDLFQSQSEQKKKLMWQEILNCSQSKNLSYQFTTDSGQFRWFSIKSTSIPDESKKNSAGFTLVFLREITTEVQKDQQLQDQERMLSAKGRLNALGEMAAGIAHEINNPLAIIVGRIAQIRKLIKKSTQEVQIESVLSKVDETIHRMNRIVQSMKSLSRDGQNDPFEKANLQTIVNDTLLLTKVKLESAGIRISSHIDPSIELECRPAQISQVILNMLHNSRDAIGHQTDKWIELSAKVTDEMVQISIVDSGLGIPEDVRNKIMQPFFTTKDIGKGTGLGLSIITNIIHSHQGELTLDTHSPNTCFLILLPVRQKREEVVA